MAKADALDLFTPLERDWDEAEKISRPTLNYWQDAWIRLRKNVLAMFGLGLIILLILMAAIGPYLTPYTYESQVLTDKNKGPSLEHWFGTDDLGRDVFTRTWYGARISLTVGFVAAFLDLLIGVIYGSFSGFMAGQGKWGDRIDNILMRIVDILYGIPYLLVVILLLVVMEPGIIPIIVALAATGWVGMARLVRGQVLQLRNQEFIMAAELMGANFQRILVRHLIPNIMGIIIVQLTLTIPSAIFAESFLSFLGLGVQAPMASWGSMASDAVGTIFSGYWWRLFFPASMIAITMFAFNVFGDGLRDALDPRLRR
ncbi:MAG: Oligopeptide transport system permease protein OppC [Candidatus Carbobacillus altaicus]|uniref:Oligopeptide transport system permease protein OppC n=1 Tax=Candidatus Carbonibacillus altaicus TaxID=2163959 RepID=A0A2R6Y5K8_9BACL|nr:MAG: Oligopeptide transport system permease protein OppC [Candidatus Carbobacillus altaicus]